MRIDINFSSSFRLTIKSASKWSSKQRLTDLDSNEFLSIPASSLVTTLSLIFEGFSADSPEPAMTSLLK
jgi:hypothetical protein